MAEPVESGSTAGEKRVIGNEGKKFGKEDLPTLQDNKAQGCAQGYMQEPKAQTAPGLVD